MSSEELSRVRLGMATAMREPSRARRMKLLHLALEHGVRKFDTAPIYGLGQADRDLASLIRTTDEGVHVTTKFGRTLSSRARFIAPLQAPLRALLKRSPRARLAARSGTGGVEIPPAPSLLDVQEHALRYCDLFGRDFLDELLTHEVPWDRGWIDLMRELAQEPGIVRTKKLGVSGAAELVESYPHDIVARLAVVQTPLGDGSKASGGQQSVLFGVLSELATRARATDSPSARYIASLAQIDSEPDAAYPLLLSVALRAFPTTDVVIGTSSPEHLQRLLSGARMWTSREDLDWNLMTEIASPTRKSA